MGENALSTLALACSIGALAIALVVALRSTPQRVRKAAFDAMQMAEEMQNGLQVLANRSVGFMEEVTRERALAAADLEQAEKKRRQAAAKMSKLGQGNGDAAQPPQSLAEALKQLPIGDPRRMALLRQAKSAADEGV